MKRLFSLSVLLSLVFTSAFLQCQKLIVETDGRKQVLSRADLEALPHVRVTVSEHSSPPVTFEGVAVKTVLEKAGVSFGEALKGKRLANCLLVEAADGSSSDRSTRVGSGIHRQAGSARVSTGGQTSQ